MTRIGAGVPYWIDAPGLGRLATMSCPAAGDWLSSAIQRLREAGVDVLVSLLPEREAEALGVLDEPAYCRQHGIDYRHYPIDELGVPASEEVTATLARDLLDELARGRSIAVHCHAGIGRSSIIAAAVLCAAGIEAEDGWRRITRARGVPVPDTEAQRAWLDKLARRHFRG